MYLRLKTSSGTHTYSKDVAHSQRLRSITRQKSMTSYGGALHFSNILANAFFTALNNCLRALPKLLKNELNFTSLTDAILYKYLNFEIRFD